MIRSDLRQAVIDSSGRTDKDSVINRGLDLGLRKLAMLHPFGDLLVQDTEALAVDDTYVTLPAGVYKVWETRLIDGTMSYPLTQKTKLWVVDRWPAVEEYTASKPVVYYVEDGKLYIAPKSDGVYDLRFTYLSLPTGFASDAEENPVNGSDLCLIDFAAAYLFRTLEQFDSSREWERQFAQDAADLIRSDKRTNALFAHSGFQQDVPLGQPNPWEDPFARRST